MTNQEKFIEVFGIDVWQQMIVFCRCAEQFKEFWTSPYEDNHIKEESDHKCHTCKHYMRGERDGSCGSYICKGYSNWESEAEE